MKWTPDKVDTLVRMYKAGERRRTMMTALGCSYKALDSRIWLLQREGVLSGEPVEAWWIADDLKIGFLDIEVDNLKADAGNMLSWALKIRGVDDPLYDVITRREIINKTYDRRICISAVAALRKIDAVVTFFGKRFDAPYLRTRCMGWGIPFPGYGELWHWDLFYQARQKLLLHRKSLEALTQFIGVEGKTHIDLRTWQHAKHGDPDSLAYVLSHNVADVMILEEAFNALEPHAKWTRESL